MGTSLTPEFWRLFAVLFVIALAVVFAAATALDALLLWVRRRRPHSRLSSETRASRAAPAKSREKPLTRAV
ncbi:hypothetical protein ABT039_17315 [Streptomyces lasiicapitis]|uniref:Uncharacterized protein n=1 Tax=Streptomyces lasiicapitis TaxID=1923961 RepID=A0ABQ2LQE6_9ACTN|nr:hypothetical protein [Streptomyces lasiicapitis]GGO41882.1 hypothetical protein GCM10012286_22380 [Streptomyces lasiicapitis]